LQKFKDAIKSPHTIALALSAMNLAYPQVCLEAQEKPRNFPNLIRYFSFVAGDLIAYRYNIGVC
jgi:hypothetical protein